MYQTKMMNSPLIYLKAYDKNKKECGWLSLSKQDSLIFTDLPLMRWKKRNVLHSHDGNNKSQLVINLEGDIPQLHRQQNNMVKQGQTKQIIAYQQGSETKEQNLNKRLKQLEKQLLQVSSQNQKLKQIVIALQNKQQKDSNSNELINKQLIPDPVPYAPISFSHNQKVISYTDCWEISVLRFLHLVFGQKGIINFDKLTKFMDLTNKHCKKLIQYFQQNKSYNFEQKSYQTKEGFQIRSLWCQFLNKSKLFTVKIENKYQVAATVPNLLTFFRGYFPRLKVNYEQLKQLTYENVLTRQLFDSYEKLLNQIYKQLSFDFIISMKINSKIIYQKQYIFFSTVQQISINNEFLLEWEIYQSYNVYKKQIGERLSGHSDYRYPIKEE